MLACSFLLFSCPNPALAYQRMNIKFLLLIATFHTCGVIQRSLWLKSWQFQVTVSVKAKWVLFKILITSEIHVCQFWNHSFFPSVPRMTNRFGSKETAFSFKRNILFKLQAVHYSKIKLKEKIHFQLKKVFYSEIVFCNVFKAIMVLI